MNNIVNYIQFYNGVLIILDYFESKFIKPVLGKMGSFGEEKEELIVGNYYKMYGWMQSLRVMNGVQHVQGISAAARSMFECLIDMKILVEDREPFTVTKECKKYISVKKRRIAKNTVDFDQKYHGLIDSGILEYYKRYLQNNTHENVKNINHWTGKNLRERAGDIDKKYEAMYLDTIQYLNLQIHTDPTGYINLKPATFENFVGLAYGLAQRCFLEGSCICAKTMNVKLDYNYLIDTIISRQDDVAICGIECLETK